MNHQQARISALLNMAASELDASGDDFLHIDTFVALSNEGVIDPLGEAQKVLNSRKVNHAA